MSIRARIQSRHEIEYMPGEMFSGCQLEAVKSWLNDIGVYVCVAGVNDDGNEEWEIEKVGIDAISDSDCMPLGEKGEYSYVSPDELRAFVKAMREAPTENYVYISWF